MNGQPPCDIPQSAPVPRISPALLEGARQLTELFERRTAGLKADYEQRIREIIHERDALIIKSQSETSQAADRDSEVATLHAEREVLWQRERVEWEQERVKWSQERAEERDRFMMELQGVRRELEDLKAVRNGLQDTLASRDAEITAMKTRVNALELELKLAKQEAALALAGFSPDQIQLNSDSYMRSPTHSSVTLTTLSTSSTLSSFEPPFPDLDPAMGRLQIDDRATEPPMDVTETVAMEMTHWHSSASAALQLRPSHSRTPTPAKSPLFGSEPELEPQGSPSLSDVDANIPISNAIRVDGDDRPAIAASTTAPRRLVIRVPPPTGKIRPPLKPRPPPLTEEQRRIVVHVPRQQVHESDEENAVPNPLLSESTSSDESESESSDESS